MKLYIIARAKESEKTTFAKSFTSTYDVKGGRSHPT